MNKNFGLTPDEFDQLVADLKKNETAFFKQVFLEHFQDCMNFLQRRSNATYDDAYDATMDALIQFRKLLVGGKLKYGNLRYLFTKMASQIYVRNQKKFQIQEIQDKDLEPIEQNPANDENNIALLNAVWNELGPNCKEVLKLHYYGKMKLTEIAAYKEKTPSAIRKQKERCIDRMRKILQKRKEIIQ